MPIETDKKPEQQTLKKEKTLPKITRRKTLVKEREVEFQAPSKDPMKFMLASINKRLMKKVVEIKKTRGGYSHRRKQKSSH